MKLSDWSKSNWLEWKSARNFVFWMNRIGKKPCLRIIRYINNPWSIFPTQAPGSIAARHHASSGQQNFYLLLWHCSSIPAISLSHDTNLLRGSLCFPKEMVVFCYQLYVSDVSISHSKHPCSFSSHFPFFALSPENYIILSTKRCIMAWDTLCVIDTTVVLRTNAIHFSGFSIVIK